MRFSACRSFAARFVQQLRDDGACVTGRNLAVGASTTASSVGLLSHMPAGLAAPSLVMVDFSVNDIYDTVAARMVAATEVWLRVLLRLGGFGATAGPLVDAVRGAAG